jgi:exodeoxyribonuclease V gamma subunit
MSVKIIKSDSLELLGEKWADDIVRDIKGSSGSEVVDVITPNKAMQSWLDDVLIKKTGVRFNINYQLPSQFLFSKVRTLDIYKNLSNPLASSREVMEWSIYFLLDSLKNDLDSISSQDKEWRVISNYLEANQKNELNKYTLARQIAQVFDAYQLYRPEMTVYWTHEKSTVDNWQAYLWQNLLRVHEEAFHNRAELLGKLRAALKDESTFPESKSNLYIFGQPTVPPVFADTLVDIAGIKYEKLSIYWPCVSEEKSKSKLVNNWLSHQRNTQKVWDKYATDIQFITDSKSDSIPSVLESIKSGIRFENLTESNLKVHICHSQRREVEVCKNELYRLLDTNPSLNASDILIMAPDIKAYIPIIESVFRKKENQDSSLLSYKIRDARDTKSYQQGAILLSYLSLVTTVVDKDDIISLLHYEAIANHYDVTQSKVNELSKLLSQTNTNAGINDEHLLNFGYNFKSLTNWESFLKKILVGSLAFKSDVDEEEILEELKPFFIGAGNEAYSLINACYQLINDIKSDIEIINQTRSLEGWLQWFEGIVKRYFGNKRTKQIDDSSMLSLLKSIKAVAQCVPEKYLTKDVIGYEVILAYLKEHLEKVNESSAFISPSITISSMVPMRSIPYKVIYLLGLDQDSFPREVEQPFFDRITNGEEPPQIGDRNRTEDDQQLLVDLLYSCTESLFISYCGMSQFNDSNYAPSPLIGEITDFVDNLYPDLVYKYKHAIHSYSVSNFTNKLLPSYDSQSYHIAKKIQDRFVEKKDAPANIWQNSPSINGEADSLEIKDETYELERLCAIIKDPTKYFFKNVLKARVKEINESDDFLFIRLPNGLNKYQIREELLQKMVESDSESEDELFKNWVKEGFIDNHGIKWQYKFLLENYSSVFETILGELGLPEKKIEERTYTIELNEKKISFTAPFIENQCIIICPSKIKGKHILLPWFASQFLALHEEFKDVEILVKAYFIKEESKKPTTFDLKLFNRTEHAESVINALVKYSDLAKTKPLAFFADANYEMNKKDNWQLDVLYKQWVFENNDNQAYAKYSYKIHNRWLWGEEISSLYDMETISKELFNGINVGVSK